MYIDIDPLWLGVLLVLTFVNTIGISIFLMAIRKPSSKNYNLETLL